MYIYLEITVKNVVPMEIVNRIKGLNKDFESLGLGKSVMV